MKCLYRNNFKKKILKIMSASPIKVRWHTWDATDLAPEKLLSIMERKLSSGMMDFKRWSMWVKLFCSMLSGLNPSPAIVIANALPSNCLDTHEHYLVVLTFHNHIWHLQILQKAGKTPPHNFIMLQGSLDPNVTFLNYDQQFEKKCVVFFPSNNHQKVVMIISTWR